MEVYIYSIATFILGIIIAYLFVSGKTKALDSKMHDLEDQIKSLVQDTTSLSQERDKLNRDNQQGRSDLAVAQKQSELIDRQVLDFKEELKNERKLVLDVSNQREFLNQELAVAKNQISTLSKQLLDYQNDVIKMEERFENLANKIFEKKTTILKEQNKDNLKDVLDPLKERIYSFEKRVNEIHKDTVLRQGELGQELKQLQELNQQVSKEAQNLTKALKGDKKIQGNWGELVLENVLNKSGLEKGREYITQESLVNDDGKRYQPDVIINMPDDTRMIVDSKVSLVAYEKMINAENEEQQKVHLHEHLAAIKMHIKSLSEKNYHELVENGPDFVLMFIPIETAFSVVVNEDHKLYLDAFQKNIIIVTPSTLLATLKTIDARWQNEKQRKNALAIAGEAGKMYDKFEALLTDLKGLGDRLSTTKKSYDSAMNKLVDGTGNLIKRAEKLKKLGAKANKQIEKDWLNKAEVDDDILEIE